MVRHDQVYQDREDRNAAAAQRMLTRIGTALERLDVWSTEAPDDKHYVTGLNIRVRYDTVGDVIAVLKADSAEGKVVGFHAAGTVSQAVLGLVNRLDNGTLLWREDIPYADRANNGTGS